ncbi:MAG: glycosyltransferase family 39 protein [Firmicutes bacterium]|nr:glycosyltransferase family 39 protein [Bacillota bacterium]
MKPIFKTLTQIPKWIYIILFGLVLFLPFLGTFELTAITEGEYSGVAREMVQRHDWISPFFNQHFWADKPPLHLWLLALSGILGGWSEFSLRLPGVFFAIGAGLLVYGIGKRFFSERIGFLGALIFFTSIETVVASQIVLVDMPLTFFIVLAVYNFLKFFHDKKSRYIYGFFAACAGAVMTKGLIGLIIPVGDAVYAEKLSVFEGFCGGD